MLFESPGSFAPLASAMLVLIVLIALLRARHLRRPQLTHRHLRGRQLYDARQLPDDPMDDSLRFRFGSRHLPLRAAYSHLAVVGATGSGKTILQRLLMQSALPRVGGGFGHRALAYDAKQDLLSLLAGMDISAPVHLLNPLDARGAAWDMAADVTSPAAALQAATLLIPKAAQDANPFFSNAARHLLYGVLLALVLNAPLRWTLRHVILILRNELLLRQVIGSTEATRFLLQYCDQASTFQNILSTILTRLAPYEIIAAAWDRAEKRISLRRWLQRESILVLGNDEDNRAALDTINQLIFKRLSELILAQPEVEPGSHPATWILLDEVRQAGRLEGLSALMTKGRSKGAAVLLGFQDISGLRDVYGREAADELVGQCATKAILRLNSPDTARWASQVFGASEFIETRKSRSRSRTFRENGFVQGGSSGVSISDSIAKRELILDSEFLDLPETSPQNGLTGYFLGATTGAYRDHLSGAWLAENLRPPSTTMPNFIARPEAHQYIRPWCDRDAADLGLSHPNHHLIPLRAVGDA